MPDIFQSDLKLKELPVLDNTGHQFFICKLREFYEPDAEVTGPAQQQLKASLEGVKKFLPHLVQENQGPFMVWSKEYPWIRFRYVLEENEPCIIIAVDTTMATADRGLLYYMTPAEVPVSTPAGSSEEEVGPYVARGRQELVDGQYPTGQVPLTELPIMKKPDTKKCQGFPSSFPINCVVDFTQLSVREGCIQVDLIVDLGNTRTVCLLLEHKGTDKARAFGGRVMALGVTPRGRPFEQPTPKETAKDIRRFIKQYAIVDSWLLLHRPLFSHLEPTIKDISAIRNQQNAFEQLRKKKYPESNLPGVWFGPPKEVEDALTGGMQWMKPWLIPQTFVEISPALIGGGKADEGAYRKFAQVSLKEGARFYLSSPKRYSWDERPTAMGDNPEWKMVNDFDPDQEAFLSLNGTFRYFMDDGAKACDRNPDENNDQILGRGPSALITHEGLSCHPVRDAIAWFALSLLETAHRQINSVYYRALWPERKDIRRQLVNVRVTYPTGWTHEERDRYLAQWKRAINLFSVAHLTDPRSVKDGGQRPTLTEESLDEAVSSQLPVIYSEIKVLGNNVPAWLSLYGDGSKVTVMNLDIGGGTTDWAVIDYQKMEKGDTYLQAMVKFKDGCNIAGDVLVKKVIERVLLPGWVKASDVSSLAGNTSWTTTIEQLLYDPGCQAVRFVDPCARLKMNRIVRLVLVPLANKILEMLVTNAGKPIEPLDIQKCIADGTIALQPIDDLNKLCLGLLEGSNQESSGGEPVSVFSPEAKVAWEQRVVDECIEDTFGKALFTRIRSLVTRYSVNLLICSGKPSEIPQVREQIHRYFPLLPQRIIHSRNYQAGEWYPDSFRTKDGKIDDAKTVTVVGAALFQEIANGDLSNNFNLEVKVGEEEDNYSREYAWGLLPDVKTGESLFQKGLFSQEDYRNFKRLDDTHIYVEKTIDHIPLGCRVGRVIDNQGGGFGLSDEEKVLPSQVYVLEYTGRELTKTELLRPVYCKAKFWWISERGKGDRLELKAIEAEDRQFAEKVNLQVANLSLNTMNERDGMFWMDNPRFEVSFDMAGKTGKR
ncbi:MAG: virulence factor SrfB [Verrucomicrobiota bacterium]